MQNWGTPQHNLLRTKPTTDPLGRGLYPNRGRGKLVPILIVSSALLVSAILVLAKEAKQLVMMTDEQLLQLFILLD